MQRYKLQHTTVMMTGGTIRCKFLACWALGRRYMFSSLAGFEPNFVK